MSRRRPITERLRDRLLEDAYDAYYDARRAAQATLALNNGAPIRNLDFVLGLLGDEYRARRDRIRSSSKLEILLRAALGGILHGRQA